MEGYLLGLGANRDAQLWYCVLEHDALLCYGGVDSGSGSAMGERGLALVERVQLTRHRIRVVHGLEGICPNRFTVHSVEVMRDDATGRFVRTGTQENMHSFVAPTMDKMRRWSRAIHNWRRHAFNDPVLSVPSVTVTKIGDATGTARKAALQKEKEDLLYFVSAFDLRLHDPLTERRRRSIGSAFRKKADSFQREEAVRVGGRRMSLPTRPIMSIALSLPSRIKVWRRLTGAVKKR